MLDLQRTLQQQIDNQRITVSYDKSKDKINE
jgi:hypothetical protein